MQTLTLQALNLLTPHRSVQRLIQPQTQCSKKAVAIVSAILGIFVIPTLISHLFFLWKDRSVTLFAHKMPPSQQWERYWMVWNVGPYKPVGYVENSVQLRVTEIYNDRHLGQEPIYGNKRTEETQKIGAKLRQLDQQFSRNHLFDNRTHGKHTYNSQALFDLLSMNQNLLTGFPDILGALRAQDQIRTCEQFLNSILVQGGKPPQSLIDAAFGDLRQYNPNPEVHFPPQLDTFRQLTNEFPHHDRQTIRNFLVYFHRFTNLDPATEARKRLRDTPGDNGVYMIHEGNVYSQNADLYIQ